MLVSKVYNCIYFVHSAMRRLCRYIPSQCTLCEYPIGFYDSLCHVCETQLIPLKDPCRYCGLPLSTHQPDKPCTADRYIHALVPACIYAPPASYLVHRLKYQRDLSCARVLGERMAQQVMRHLRDNPYRPDCLIPIPLFHRRQRERGFNQAAEIARVLSRRLGLPVDHTLCSRVKKTQGQTDLTFRQRRINMRGAFAVKHSHHYRHVALIDDVVTTRATVSELAKVLRRAGVQRVDVWCAARTNAP